MSSPRVPGGWRWSRVFWRGFAIGLAAHGIGTARAFQADALAGAFAAIAMGLNGAFTAIALPLILPVLDMF